MIQLILDALKYADGETENIRIAQGKFALPKTFKGVLKSIKKNKK